LSTLSKLVLLSCAVLSVATVSAKDLGVHGATFPILERDIRQAMIEQAAQVEWDKVQEDVRESGRVYLDNLPKRRLPTAAQDQVVWLDPSIELGSDIQVPVKQPDGTFSWQVLASKGTRVNPLETTRPVTALLFFDGSDPDQFAAVQEVLRREPLRVVPVEAGQGSVRTGTETFARPVFHANDAMVARFQVRYLPSIVFPGTGDRSLFLGIASFAAPYVPAEILAAWPELPLNQPTSTGAR